MGCSARWFSVVDRVCRLVFRRWYSFRRVDSRGEREEGGLESEGLEGLGGGARAVGAGVVVDIFLVVGGWVRWGGRD